MFDGKNDQDRCATWLEKIVAQVELLEGSDIATHSMRKGGLSLIMSHPGGVSHVYRRAKLSMIVYRRAVPYIVPAPT